MISDMLRFGPSLFEGLDEIFMPEIFALSRVANRVFPLVNMGVTDKSVEVYLFTPGMSATELDVTLEKNLLSIAGERKREEVNDADYNKVMKRNERLMGRFQRIITLPEDVNPDETEAVYSNGVLHISITKKEKAQPHQIKVEV